MSNKKYYLGLNKGDHHSSVCLLEAQGPLPQIEILLTERLRGVKYVGGWPAEALDNLIPRLDHPIHVLAENSFGHETRKTEMKWDENYPFFQYIKQRHLCNFSSHFNPDIRFFTHHLCHAMSAALLSPFMKSLIMVQDGMGNLWDAFPSDHEERLSFPLAPSMVQANPFWAESCSVYLQDGLTLRCVWKEWQQLKTIDEVRDQYQQDPEDFSEGLGAFYGAVAKFVFNSFHDAGKLMGLAPYGTPGKGNRITSRWDYLQGLNWSRTAFKGKGKKEWESSGNFQLYADMAASVQEHFEEANFGLLLSLKELFPECENLILTGGCALNCVFNMKAYDRRIFPNIYVPPFPGDEGISLGAAGLLYTSLEPVSWQPRQMDNQTSSFGPLSSVAKEKDILSTFQGFSVLKPDHPEQLVARMLAQGKIVGLFQGRSETGPRALGHRSILASPLTMNLRQYLNERVKYRESFRPYGSSCLWEKATEYFHVPPGFDSPFMSFAPLVRSAYREELQEVAGVDGTSRIQTVRQRQNPRLHRLLEEFGKETGIHVLLNTSLNIMGRPIAETLLDALEFFKKAPVDALMVENLVILRPQV